MMNFVFDDAVAQLHYSRLLTNEMLFYKVFYVTCIYFTTIPRVSSVYYALYDYVLIEPCGSLFRVCNHCIMKDFKIRKQYLFTIFQNKNNI